VRLRDILEWLSTKIDCPQYYQNKDGGAERSITIYNSRRSPMARIALGGLDNTSYTTTPITLLVKWGNSNSPAEEKAKEVFNVFYGQKATIAGKRVIMFEMITTVPISVGTDDNGNFEYVIEINILHER